MKTTPIAVPNPAYSPTSFVLAQHTKTPNTAANPAEIQDIIFVIVHNIYPILFRINRNAPARQDSAPYAMDANLNTTPIQLILSVFNKIDGVAKILVNGETPLKRRIIAKIMLNTIFLLCGLFARLFSGA
jgi:hypothetical protein